MNLYTLHENPRLLHRYHDAMVKLPDIAFSTLNRYYNNLSLAEKYAIERAVAKSAKYSYLYAARVKHERFPEGEAAIAENSEYALKYAKYLADNFEEEFPEGEAAIAKDPWHAVEYALYVKHERFPEGEAAIASNPDTAYRYAVDIIGGRWPRGEAAIRKDEGIYQMYKEFLDSLR